MSPRPASPVPALAADDLWRFGEGTHDGLAYLLGAHPDADGTTFRVWAPSARSVAVIGDFDRWSRDGVTLTPSPAGIWAGRVGAANVGNHYKYRIVTATGAVLDKSDPFAFATEEPPRTASVITTLDYDWGDTEWMAQRAARNRHDAPISTYEMHLGSWRYEPGGYRAIAVQLADYLERTGFTHVELMPVMEHPYYGSWGYQTTGYFAATARYGSPQDLMFMIDHLHQRGFGVILDWVPSHYPTDAHGLAEFDGTHLYEHADPRLGFHPDWKSAIFNYDRHEVRSFLLSSARFWVERYHADAIRVDAVASMLYRDYSRAAGEWIPNQHGGRENLGAIAFLQEFNRRVYLHHPDTFTVAEESTAWPGVTHPTDGGGLGFGYKWDMGWMNDTLEYFRRESVHRRWHHGELTFRTVYAFHESFVLPLSHDEVVHGKGSLLSRQPGDRWQQFAGLRLLFGYQYGQPGKKLIFMGSEFGMPQEWNHERELPWDLLQFPEHSAVLDWVAALNILYRNEPSLHRCDGSADGFRWVVGNDDANSVIAFLRLATGHRPVLVVCNFTAVPRNGYRIGVPVAGRWTTLLNGDDQQFGGGGIGSAVAETEAVAAHGHDVSLLIDVPPLAVCFLAPSLDTT
jgi:1,4-alpha-glucan branching enzyme